MKKFLFFIFFMTLFLPVASGEEPAPGWQTDFRDELSISSQKVVALAPARFSRIKNVNDSYHLTAEAVLLLDERGDTKEAIPLLRKATKKFDGNRLAYLLLGAVFERIGDREGAIQAYSGFYKHSLTLVPEENKIIDRSALTVFRNYVEARFEQWEVPLSESKVGLALQRVRSMVMLEGSPSGQWINMVVPMIVVIGIPVLILCHLTGTKFPYVVSYFLMSFYLLCAMAYALWAVHLFLGLPFFVSPETEYKLYFAGGVILIPAFYVARRFLAHKRRANYEGGKYCPSCGAVMLTVEMECPNCKRRIQE